MINRFFSIPFSEKNRSRRDSLCKKSLHRSMPYRRVCPIHDNWYLRTNRFRLLHLWLSSFLLLYLLNSMLCRLHFRILPRGRYLRTNRFLPLHLRLSGFWLLYLLHLILYRLHFRIFPRDRYLLMNWLGPISRYRKYFSVRCYPNCWPIK